MRLFNLTDHPKFVSSVINLYKGNIFPGQSISIDDELVTDKVLALGDRIAVGKQPEWYLNWKNPPAKFKYEPPQEVTPSSTLVATSEFVEDKKKNGRK